MKHVSYLVAGAFGIGLAFGIVHLLSEVPEITVGMMLLVGSYLFGWLLLGKRKT